ncbi:hypothetical protein [Lutimonas zeaxanthinifaciens]|uniref:hypothetical protein n=1 Tax=Lutimonas zeaxanthinifaciens TaxID=3060215 RepID=UPI00265CC30B|nr:hypothetical protein [Lutimonas sp. YSD2104]WKK65924.1 hypothetical protein QZH61_15210 [Lutimonas sp. YSD2104]
MKYKHLILGLFLVSQLSIGQELKEYNGASLQDYESFSVDSFYKKIELDYGTLDEYGNHISIIYAKSEVKFESGQYEIEISDGPGELYEVIGADLFVQFRGYYGDVGYRDKCVLAVQEDGVSVVYKLE